jgi:hypothetical protein
MVSCCVKRRLPPDLFPDDLNGLLNICNYSVTMVGDERLPPAPINRLPASLVSSHISWPFVAYSPLFSSFPINYGQEQEGGSSSHHSGDKRKREPSPPSEDFGDSEYSEELSSESEGSPVYASPPVSSDDSDDSQGIAAELWTYIRAIERSGLEGSDDDEGDDSDGCDDGGGGDGDGKGDDDSGSSKADGKAPLA